MFICCRGIRLPRQHHGNQTHLVETLHVIRFHPVPGNGGIPSVAREVVDKGLEEASKLSFGFLDVNVSAPDNEVCLRGSLARSHGSRGGVSRLCVPKFEI